MAETRTEAGPVFRVILRMEVNPGMEPEFEETWTDIAGAVARDPANLGQWLMRGCDGPSVYYVVSDWRDKAAFGEFEGGEAHREHRARLGPLRHGGWMITAEVVHTIAGQSVPA